ncbi:hypothetical protein C6P45_002235 [Maudiozyma exigua]|uniref:Uncharacterized protein n=1 Tax=Maudiozyma exigua TaxID=34358 RepID=A0A9P7B436_MAUEX|nr:hypothetical protein C6P45_002235 [Kazachstania exigua]
MTTVSNKNELKTSSGSKLETNQKNSGRKLKKVKNDDSTKFRNIMNSRSTNCTRSSEDNTNKTNYNKKLTRRFTKSKSRTNKSLKNNDWSTSFDEDTVSNQDKFQFKNNSKCSKRRQLDSNSKENPIIMINQSIQTDPPLSRQIDSLFNTPIKTNNSLFPNSRANKLKFTHNNTITTDWNDSFEIVTPIKERRWSGETIYSENISLLSPLNSPRHSVIDDGIITNTTNTPLLLVNDKINFSKPTKTESKYDDSDTFYDSRINSIIELLSKIGKSNDNLSNSNEKQYSNDIIRWNEVPDCCQI